MPSSPEDEWKIEVIAEVGVASGEVKYVPGTESEWKIFSAAAQLAISFAHEGEGSVPLVSHLIDRTSEPPALRLDTNQSRYFNAIKPALFGVYEAAKEER